jgi:chromosome segregation protein
MRLKQLEVVGLKSFANRTTLDFHPGVTAIVGPNGCGKSNVVDAIRWVLGEQSAKHLRGDSMEDIIFKGNGRVPPAGMAEVSLTFSNDDPAPAPTEEDLDVSTLPEHFRNLSEITVSRRYFRSGESEYYINRTPCRLKDITELFLGTGIGSKAYAIIEQGRVEQLINSKPEDRRLFIEEAGGTTLYRSRRIAAERKIERTRENLLRVNDVLREIERQIQYLNRLAKRAEKYRTLRDELRGLDLRLGSHRWRRLDDAVQELSTTLAALGERATELRTEEAELEGRRAELSAARRSADERLATLKEAAAVAVAERDSAQQRGGLLRRELDERRRRAERLRSSEEAMVQQRDSMARELAEAQAERDALVETLREEEEAVRAAEVELARVRDSVRVARGKVEQVKQQLVALASAESDARNEKNRLERARLDAEGRRRKAETDTHMLGEQIAAAELAVANRRAALAKLEVQLADAQGTREGVAATVRDLAARLGAEERRLGSLREEAVKHSSTLDSLRQIHDTYEGYAPAVRSLLAEESRPDWVLGVVGDLIEAPVELERALAAALGPRVNYIVVREPEDATRGIDHLQRSEAGRGSFLPAGGAEAPETSARALAANHSGRVLVDEVTIASDYRTVAEKLLGSVVLVPDLPTAMAARGDVRNGLTVVTIDGEVVDSAGAVTGGAQDLSEQELVSRRRRIQESSGRLDETRTALVSTEAAVARLRADQVEQQRRLAELDQQTQRLTAHVVAVERDIEKVGLDLPRWRDRQRLARFECGAARRDVAGAIESVRSVEQSFDRFTRERSAKQQDLEQCESGLRSEEARLDSLGEGIRRATASLAEKQKRNSVLDTIRTRLLAEQRGVTSRLGSLVDDLREIGAQVTGLEAAIAEADEATASRKADAERLAGEVEGAVSQLAKRAGEFSRCEAEWDANRSGIETARAGISRAEIALAEQRMRREHLAEDVSERYGLAIAEVPPEEPLADGEEEEIGARVQEIRENLSRMGEVNTGAIEELSELEERAGFLRGQREDLERSIADLERTIQRLNRVSRSRFLETFNAANERFQEILPRLLRGGEARLVLTDENNLLETGVEIFVRPPGKRLDSITLLSGGEKALVAVSMIFSLFMINPTPFCFLDEVDAPLDDANIGRFSGLVREMSDRSQFIVITHNKRTMEAANALYGVTMEEPGISKIISVATI